MFDIGFLELLICSVIALLVLGPERLPTAARAAGRWIGGARRMVSQFSSELDRQLKADELKEQLRQAGDVGLEDVEKTVRDALDEARQYQHMVVSDTSTRSRPAPATRRVRPPEQQPDSPENEPPATPADGDSTEANQTPPAPDSPDTSTESRQ